MKNKPQIALIKVNIITFNEKQTVDRTAVVVGMSPVEHAGFAGDF